MRMSETFVDEDSGRSAKKREQVGSIFVKQEIKAKIKEIEEILKKDEVDRIEEEVQALQNAPDIVELVTKRLSRRVQTKERLIEKEDPPDILETKCRELAEAIRTSKNTIFYTGAGISTSASIPDYRGPNGVWTMLQKGKKVACNDLTASDPTLTHMAIYELDRRGLVKYVVSQNCDGLHARSGLPLMHLSEIHGNMYLEMCMECEPQREYFRLFDVTERTMFRRHFTGRLCPECGGKLKDSIVHFGEKGFLQAPHRWERAAAAVEGADTIVCLGSSLKVLRRYPCLWPLGKPDSPKLFIVNLQWTPKDDVAFCKINGKCDTVMALVMKFLDEKIPTYHRDSDPLFALALTLKSTEEGTKTRPNLLLHNTKNEPVASSSVTSEEEEETNNSTRNSPSGSGQEMKMEQMNSEQSAQVAPGWFGKGYNKIIKKKKRKRSKTS